MSKFKITQTKLVIGMLLLALVGITTARLSCPSAIERADAISLEDVKRDVARIEAAKKMLKVLEEIAATPPGSAKYEEKINALIDLQDLDTQAYLKSLPREDRLEALTKKIAEGAAAKERENMLRAFKDKFCGW
jgi:hypothetical protein